MTFDNGDAKDLLVNKCSDNNRNLKKNCLNANKDTTVLANSERRLSLNKNSNSFKKGDSMTKAIKLLEEKNETKTRVGDQLSTK